MAAEKLRQYQGTVGWLHQVRDNLREKYTNFKDNWKDSRENECITVDQDYSHIYRQKTRGELVRISAAVMGIEFSYAAETAFVSPILLKIGVAHRHMTLVWGLSPLVGFFLTPILGSLSDRCPFVFGRRRPFIILLSAGVFLGLLLVPNGEYLGYLFGDTHGMHINSTADYNDSIDNFKPPDIDNENEMSTGSHPWGLLFTVLGTVLLDFDADACQSPARAYLLDVTQPDDHARGLSTFTVMAGLGGCMGYAMGGINWDNTALGIMLGGHVRAVFTIITFIFIFCVISTITSFREIPLSLLHQETIANHEAQAHNTYGSLDNNQVIQEEEQQENNDVDKIEIEKEYENLEEPIATDVSLRHYLLSIIHMPKSLQILCATNFFCWSAHVCYSLYFTDYVGEAVFGGDPKAPEGSYGRDLYEEGVRFGCWGMAMYSLSCSCYSLIIEKLVQKYRAKRVYVGGQLVYCTGMTLLALTRHKASVLIFSWTAGVMYSTLFTMPYLLVAHYHAKNKFSAEPNIEERQQLRGLGTDVAIVSSMVFLAQLTLSMCMGTIVSWAETTTAVVSVAACLSFCGSICATKVLYLEL